MYPYVHSFLCYTSKSALEEILNKADRISHKYYAINCRQKRVVLLCTDRGMRDTLVYS